MDLPQIDNYEQLLVNDTPLLDVRAPVEFSQGAFPQAKNMPLMNDSEREAVGIRYKEQGQDQAINLGHELISGDIKQARMDAWDSFIRAHPQGALYCFRGGMRSKISQHWIYEHTGVVYPRVKGGYKALRRYLLEELERAPNVLQFWVLCGRTGVGKTLLIDQITQKIDLEAIYQHRGSAFGKRLQPQPSQIDVENRLAIELLKHRIHKQKKLIIEDEAVNIGSRRVPDSIAQMVKQSPLIMLEADIEKRIDNVFAEYIEKDLAAHHALFGASRGFDVWSENLLNALDKIHKRLGGARHKNLKNIMQDAIQRHRNQDNASHHKDWIRLLLIDYYDPMYDYQLSQKINRVIFRGTTEVVLEHIHEYMLQN